MISKRGAGLAAILVATQASILPSQTRADTASIRAFYGEWMGAAAQKGPEAYASYYAEAGTLLPPNEAPVVGRTAIADWLRRAQADPLTAPALPVSP